MKPIPIIAVSKIGIAFKSLFAAGNLHAMFRLTKMYYNLNPIVSTILPVLFFKYAGTFDLSSSKYG